MEKLEIDTWKDVCLLQICEFKRERKKNSKIQEKTCSVIPFLILKKKYMWACICDYHLFNYLVNNHLLSSHQDSALQDGGAIFVLHNII